MVCAGISVDEEITEFDSDELLSFMAKYFVPVTVEVLRLLESDEQLIRIFDEAKKKKLIPDFFGLAEARRHFNIFRTNFVAQQNYVPRPYPGKVTLFRASEMSEDA